jgi:hypothetical protein
VVAAITIEQQIADPDAGHEPRQEPHQIRLRPRRGLPEVQREQIHRDEQGREQAAGGDRVHHHRQQRNADDGESATECALHEADQEYAGKGDQDGGDGQFHDAASIVDARRRPPARGPIAAGEAIIPSAAGRSVVKPQTAASIWERVMPMSRSSRSSNSRSIVMATRRAK